MAMKALTLDADQQTGVVCEIPPPHLQPDELLIRVKAVALNPVDVLYTRHPLGRTGRVIGSDFAGTVVKIGASVPSTANIQEGSNVSGFLQGACSINDRPGAFAELVACPWDLVWQIGSLSFEEAATVSLCCLTAAQALYIRLGVPSPFSPISPTAKIGFSIFINGATTSVGLYAAQLIRKSAIPIRLVGTASQKHFPLLRGDPYSYDHLVDYRDSEWEKEVKGTKGVDIAFDCISEGDSVLRTRACLSDEFVPSNLDFKARVAVVRSRAGGAWSGSAEEFADVEPSYGAVWEGLGFDVEYQGMVLPKNNQLREFSVTFFKWLSEGRNVIPNPVRSMPGGLGRIVEDGFQLLGSSSMADRRSGDSQGYMRPVSGEKLVYLVD